jgi:hypothetical protein
MAHYAEVENGIVTRVIVAEAEFIATLPGTWVQTSYNTRGGIHYDQNGNPDGGIALRKNYAGIGYTYDPINDAFYAPKPSALYELDSTSYLWKLKAEYSPLVAVKMISTSTTIPVGVVGGSMTIDGITINDKTLVFFPVATTSPGVYKYFAELGSLEPHDYSTSVIQVQGDNTQVWKFTAGAWVSQPVV